MAQASKAKRKAMRAPRRKGGGGNTLWYSVTAVIVVLGVVAVAISRDDRVSNADVAPLLASADRQGDHWHTGLGVWACGTWLPNLPEFETRAGSGQVQAGIHSHGDGLMHIHPFVPDEAGNNATVGTFLDFAGYTITDERLELWDGSEYKPGDDCNGKPGVIRWLLNGEEQEGSPSEYKPNDGDLISVFFTTADADIASLEKNNPGKANLAAPADLAGEQPIDPTLTVPVDPSESTTPTAPADSSSSNSSLPPGSSPTTAATNSTETTAAGG